jgi:DNA-binding beta-propeller fold protein YncE
MMFRKLVTLTSVALAVALLSACGTTTDWSQIGPAPATRDVADASRLGSALPPGDTVYVAGSSSGDVLLFNGSVKSPRQIGQIVDTGGVPYVDVVDDTGMLYILDDAEDVIYEYPRGAIHPSRILTKGLESGAALPSLWVTIKHCTSGF